MYEYQHYPLAMYRNGEYMAVANEAEEQAMKARGWADWYTDKARLAGEVAAPVAAVEPVAIEQKRKPGRPRKNG